MSSGVSRVGKLLHPAGVSAPGVQVGDALAGDEELSVAAARVAAIAAGLAERFGLEGAERYTRVDEVLDALEAREIGYRSMLDSQRAELDVWQDLEPLSPPPERAQWHALLRKTTAQDRVVALVQAMAADDSEGLPLELVSALGDLSEVQTWADGR